MSGWDYEAMDSTGDNTDNEKSDNNADAADNVESGWDYDAMDSTGDNTDNEKSDNNADAADSIEDNTDNEKSDNNADAADNVESGSDSVAKGSFEDSLGPPVSGDSKTFHGKDGESTKMGTYVYADGTTAFITTTVKNDNGVTTTSSDATFYNDDGYHLGNYIEHTIDDGTTKSSEKTSYDANDNPTVTEKSFGPSDNLTSDSTSNDSTSNDSTSNDSTSNDSTSNDSTSNDTN